MKKHLSIIVLGLLLSGNAYANKKDVSLYDKSKDWIRVLHKFPVWFLDTPEQSDYKFSIATKMGERHCDNYNKSMYRFLSQRDGDPLRDAVVMLGKNYYTFYCANSLKEALEIYEVSGLQKHESWAGPIFFEKSPNYQRRSVKKTLIYLENERKRREVEKRKREAEKRLAEQRKREAEKRLAEQKKLAEANKKNSPSKSNSSGKERAKQAMSYRGGVAMKGFLGGLIGMALGFGLYSIMDRKIKKKINDKYFLGAAFFIGWIISKFV